MAGKGKQRQQRVLLDLAQRLQNPYLDSYLAQGGFKGASRVGEMGPEALMLELRANGLRERGPDGQPLFLKWQPFLFGAMSELWVDAIEPDPGSLAGSTLLARNPCGLMEGLAIAAGLTGAVKATVVLSPHLEEFKPQLSNAFAQAREKGLLAGLAELNLLGAGREVMPSPREGALVMALETWYQLVAAMAHGPEDYQAFGQGGQSGTKLLTLGGQVKLPGLVEVPFGCDLAAVLRDLAQVEDLERSKAVALDQGVKGFLSPAAAQVALAPEELALAGANHAFATLWVLDHNQCLVYLTQQAMTKSWELATRRNLPGRQRLLHALRLVTEISRGKGSPGHLTQLKGISGQLSTDPAIAIWPLRSSLKYFEGDWQEHLNLGECPLGVFSHQDLAPCRVSCPAGIDIPSFLALVGHGRYLEAVEVIRRDNPLPYICGLVCPAPCEIACLRSELDQPISIRAMKAVAARHALEQGGYPRPERQVPSGKRVAVIGAGPAGLSAAFFLNLAGHQVTIFEASDRVGGTAYWGIPAYRLPRGVIEAEAAAIAAEGVEIQTGRALGGDFSLADLRSQGFEAVFLGLGAGGGYRLGLSGEDRFPQVLDALGFLRRVAQGDTSRPAEEVVVVGGGNAAIDAARTCLRLGCSKVTIAYRRSRDEMPAHHQEVEDCLHEGAQLRLLAVPKELAGADGQLSGLTCLNAKLSDPDSSGRRRPIPQEGSEFTIACGAVIAAIGQAPELECLGPLSEDEFFCGARINASGCTGHTSYAWIFAGGDCVSGPATVVEAVAAGKNAAHHIDGYLRGHSCDDQPVPLRRHREVECLASDPRQRTLSRRPTMPTLALEERLSGFEPVERGLSDQMALSEAERCLRCDLCIGCGLCELVCNEVEINAIKMRATVGGRLLHADFIGPAEACVGCGACANACPTGAIEVRDQGAMRRTLLTGTCLQEQPLIACYLCDKPFATQAQLDLVVRRRSPASQPERTMPVCPSCARQLRAVPMFVPGRIGR